MSTFLLETPVKTLPPADEMYRALLARDTSYDGSFIAAIRTTGIFCRPGCGAKKPKRENVEFFARAADAQRRGFRACLRCRPLDPVNEPPRAVRRAIERSADSSRDLREAGEGGASRLDEARASRWMRAHFGMTLRAYDRGRRLGLALDRIRAGVRVTEAALESGFESESGFRDAFVRLFGSPPTRAAAQGASVLRVRWIPSPLGPMLAAATDVGVCLLEFADRRALPSQIATLRRRIPLPVLPGSNEHLDRLAEELAEYFEGTRRSFTVPIVAPGTPFQSQVWDLLRAIPPGETRSYGELARELGRPSAVRALARANGDNRMAILIPCHRVIGADGSPVGYGGGVWRKQWLLAHERQVGAAKR